MRDLPSLIKSAIPNIITLGNCASGLTSIFFVTEGKYSVAIILILLAAILDVFDGRIARMLGVQSEVGAQLDSFSDLTTFGLAAPFLVYNFVIDNYAVHKGVLWVVIIVYILCSVYRLAKFNVTDSLPKKDYWKFFFSGLPTPGAAFISTLPVLLMLYGFEVNKPSTYMLFLLLSSFLMVSNVPTLSVKRLKFREFIFVILALIFIVIFGHLALNLWIVLIIIDILYLVTIPITTAAFLIIRKKHNL